MSSSSPSSSSSSDCSNVASSLSWYSVMRSLTFLSASWNSISSMPSPLYQCRNAFLLYILANCALILWNTPLMAVVLATKVADRSVPSGGTVMMADLMLFGIHDTKSSAILAWILAISSSTSEVAIDPLYPHDAVKYLPSSAFTLERKLRDDHI